MIILYFSTYTVILAVPKTYVFMHTDSKSARGVEVRFVLKSDNNSRVSCLVLLYNYNVYSSCCNHTVLLVLTVANINVLYKYRCSIDKVRITSVCKN